MANEIKTIAWFIIKKSMIKFEGDEDSLTISEKVMKASDFTKCPIVKGDKVEVTVQENEVVFLKKSTEAVTGDTETKEEPKTEDKTEAPKEEKKAEPKAKQEEKQPPTDVKGDVKEVTIFAVSGNKEVVKFSKDTAWVHISKEVQAMDYRTIGLIAKTVVKVTLENGIIVKVEKLAQPEKKEEKSQTSTTSTKKTGYGRDEDATDRRTASMNAKDIVVAMLNNKLITDKQVKDVVGQMTKEFYNVTKNL